jgi:succinoglycan biosynthesis protein ExoM
MLPALNSETQRATEPAAPASPDDRRTAPPLDSITVCVPTFRRNRMLEKLLRNLARQETGGLFTFSAVIIDNDARGPARETVEALQRELPFEIKYAIEPEQTIPAARNRALSLADGNYIAIIDDDEFPPPEWLLRLYQGIQTFDVDGALGPVLPYFESHPPEWLKRSGMCDRPILPTGTLLRWNQTRTGNVLLKRSVFDRHNLLFDVTLRTGGSDREFFKHAMRAGCQFVSIEEAPVYEIVPPERWTRSYYFRRALVNGFNANRNAAHEKRSLLQRAILPVRLFGSALACAVILPFAALMGSHVAMRVVVSGAHHASRLAGMLGVELVKKRDF